MVEVSCQPFESYSLIYKADVLVNAEKADVVTSSRPVWGNKYYRKVLLMATEYFLLHLSSKLFQDC